MLLSSCGEGTPRTLTLLHFIEFLPRTPLLAIYGHICWLIFRDFSFQEHITAQPLPLVTLCSLHDVVSTASASPAPLTASSRQIVSQWKRANGEWVKDVLLADGGDCN